MHLLPRGSAQFGTCGVPACHVQHPRPGPGSGPGASLAVTSWKTEPREFIVPSLLEKPPVAFCQTKTARRGRPDPLRPRPLLHHARITWASTSALTSRNFSAPIRHPTSGPGQPQRRVAGCCLPASCVKSEHPSPSGIRSRVETPGLLRGSAQIEFTRSPFEEGEPSTPHLLIFIDIA